MVRWGAEYDGKGERVKFRRIGRTGLKVSELCLGTMTFGGQCDRSTSFAIMDAALEGGITFFDTADAYPLPSAPETIGRTEELVGAWLRERRQRQRVVLATKVYAAMGPEPNDRGLSRRHIMEGVEGSLRRLGTDCIDLYQSHRADPETPIDETMRAFDDLVRQGKVRYLGASNYSAWELATAIWTSKELGLTRYDCVQPRYNLLFRDIEAELLPLCLNQGVGVIAYNPLAGGFLSGKHRLEVGPLPGTRFTLGTAGEMYRGRYWHEASFRVTHELKTHFESRGIALASVAVAWVLRQPGITAAIVGASRAEQLEDTLASTDLALDDESLQVLDDAWYALPRARPGSPQTR